VLKHVFFHNPHDKQSRDKLVVLQGLDVQIDEVVDVTDASAKARFPAYRLRTAPAYVVLEMHGDQHAVLFSAEGGNIDPLLLDAMVFEALAQGPQLTPEQRELQALKALLAQKDALIEQMAGRLTSLEAKTAEIDLRTRKLVNPV
jgi:hypothetical protein